jgi:hypothetical protein
MTDIVERLRAEAAFHGEGENSLEAEAADEIERLRAALKFYAEPCDSANDGDGNCGYRGNTCCMTARAALTQEGK